MYRLAWFALLITIFSLVTAKVSIAHYFHICNILVIFELIQFSYCSICFVYNLLRNRLHPLELVNRLKRDGIASVAVFGRCALDAF